MANFRIHNGMFVKITDNRPGLIKGNKYQVLVAPRILGGHISFVGVDGIYPIKGSGKWLEPSGETILVGGE